MTKRNQNPKIGKLDLAGGFTDPKESAEETCAKRIKKKIGDRNRPQQFKIRGKSTQCLSLQRSRL